MNNKVRSISKSEPLASFSRRAVVLGGLSVALWACTQTILEPEVAQSVTIRRVSVITSELANFNVRELDITQERFASDLKARVENKLGDRLASNGNAELVISVTRVLLKSPGLSLIAGGPSLIDAQVLVRQVSDGSAISGPSQFSGTSGPRMGGILGAISAPTAQDDYLMTLDGFATMINAALFEGGATMY